VDATKRVAWISAQCGHGNDPIWAVNADTHTVITEPIGCGASMARRVNPATGRCYQESSGAKRVDPHTFAVTKTTFGTVIGVNASANILYAKGPKGVLQIVNGEPDS